MISVFEWPDPNTGFNQSEHALYTCYFIIQVSVCFISRMERIDFDQLMPSGGVILCC